MRILFYILVLKVAFCLHADAQDGSIFPKGELSVTNNHTGDIWLNELVKPDSIFNNSSALAAFKAGAKLDWHIHPAGQILLITEGKGFYQEKGQPAQAIHKGEVIKCMPGITHWHGAAPDSRFAYLAITPAQKGKTIWLSRVTDEEYAQVKNDSPITEDREQQILALSKKKWEWMSAKNADSLDQLFAEKSIFVHMGGSWGKEQEMNIIKSGGIWYKKTDIHSATVSFTGNTAILLNNITLLAVVGGNEVANPFIVTEVYIIENNKWVLGSLSFTKLLTPEDTRH